MQGDYTTGHKIGLYFMDSLVSIRDYIQRAKEMGLPTNWSHGHR